MNELFELYVKGKVRKRHARGEIQNTRQILSYFVEFPYEEWPEAYDERIRNVGDVRANTIFRYVRAFVNWLYRNNHVEKNLLKEFMVPRSPKLMPKSLTRNQAKQLIKVASKHSLRARVVFSTYLYTGMRKNELLLVGPEHVDLDFGVIIVKGKGNKQRAIAINDGLIDLLRYWERKRIPGDNYFNINRSTLLRIKKLLQERLPFDFTLHMLRHTFGTMMARAGADLVSLKELMGHTTVKTTEIYLSSSSEHKKKQVDKLQF